MLLARLSRWPTAKLLVLLWIAAIVLALVGLGAVPLRDWDEGIVARVALETSQRPWPEKLMPTYWGHTYANKPPGLHLLIAGCINLWRQFSGAEAEALPPEWVLRLAPALLSTTLVPLMGAIQGQLRPGERAAALASAAITLTLLPLARHGRLAMLDGCQLVAIASLWLALLQARGKERGLLAGGLGAGLATSALLLLKAPLALPLLIGSLAIRSLERDLSKRSLLLLMVGVGFGLIPGAGWHLLNALVRAPAAYHLWLDQGYARVARAMEGHPGGPIVPLLELLEGGGPWLLLWPFGIALAWRQRRSRWGLWCIGLSLLMALLVLPLRTQLPWYSLLLWPPFILLCGPVLARLTQRPQPVVPQAWWWLGVLLLSGAGLALGAGLLWSLPSNGWLAAMAAALALGLLAGSRQLQDPRLHQRQWGLILLVGGCWLSLLLLMASPLWLWELQESWSAPAAAQLIAGQPGDPVVAIAEGERPSLSWYAGRRVMGLRKAWRQARDQGLTEVTLIAAAPPHDPHLHCVPQERSGAIGLYRCSRQDSLARDRHRRHRLEHSG